MFQLHDFFHDVLPGALGGFGITHLKICAGDLHIDDGLTAGFVLGVEEPPGLGAVFRAQRLLLSGDVVLNPVNGPPKEHAVFLSHNFSVTSLRQPECPRYSAVRVSGRCWSGALTVSAMLLTFWLTDASQILLNRSTTMVEVWRRGSESNASGLPQATRNQLPMASLMC